ncbi:MAG: phosphatidylserine/phosphatidylglycerophosphate/cardiolipin synthase family protein [Myxococcota bacterium]
MSERVIIVVEPADELLPVLSAAQRIAPEAGSLHLVALLQGSDEPHRDNLARALEALEAELAGWPSAPAAARTVATSLELSFESPQVEGALVVAGPWRSRPAHERVLALLELSSHARMLVSVGARTPPLASGPAQPLCVAFTDPAMLPALVAAAPGQPGAARLIGLAVGAGELHRDELEQALRAVWPGGDVELELLRSSALDAAAAVEAAAARWGAELIIVPRERRGVLTALTSLLAAETLQSAGRPWLVVPMESPRGRRLVASDSIVIDGSPAWVTLELVGALGRLPIEGARVRLPHASQPAVVGRGGVAALPAAPVSGERGLRPFVVTLEGEEAVGGAVANVVGEARPLVLVDADLPPDSHSDLERLVPDFELLFVRLRADAALHELRDRLRSTLPWGGPALVLDASTWLCDDGAADVPRAVDPLRLVRLGVHLRQQGVRVAAVVLSNNEAPAARDFQVFTPATLARYLAGTLVEAAGPRETVEILTGARPVTGNAVTLELDNAEARAALLHAAAGARERLHLQSYIFEDDDVVRSVCDALAAAAARGVVVRVLADALYSLHGAYGATNPALARLAASGVEVRAWQPLRGPPSIRNLKARNHRKLLIVDGERAWVSGRNLGAVYYRGLDEVRLTRESLFADVPWVDCSARVDGPVVAEIERAFLTDWVRAGGAPYDIREPAPAGTLECRLVRHEGLADANTLELQRLLIDRAQRRLVLVSTFPLLLELQRALIAAVERGVRVQLLFGNVRPRWGDGTPFGGGAYRELGDELVRARLEPVLRAGAEGYEVSLAPRRGWSSDLGRVFPHVHAKLLVRDEAEVAVGSANVDVTSAYWESEALLLVSDEGFARQTLSLLEPLLAGARRVDSSAPEGSLLRVRREWLGRLWPNLIG